ncbi:MAG TPA: cold shock domain-containing protein [Calditrichia bacterium]|nr:cold shock domain-containing protein [Calditrichia bacterium]
MQYGEIKMYDPIKAFGFIVDEDQDEFFFSKSDLHPKSRNQPLREGTRVGFDVKREMRGDKAINVRIL